MKLLKKAYLFYISFFQLLIGRKKSFAFDSLLQKIFFISFLGTGLTFVISIVFMGCCVNLLNVINYPRPIEEIGVVIQNPHQGIECGKEHLFLLFLYGCVLCPIFEEVLFRLPLIYSKRNFIGVLLAYAALGGFISQRALCRLINGAYFDFNYKIPIVCLIIALVLVVILNIKGIDNLFKLLFNKHWLWFYYAMAIFFCSLHTLFPFSIVANIPWIITQGSVFLWSGLYLGYIRVAYGLKWSIANHMIWNSSMFLLTMIWT